jgi:hypothetical protein
MRQLSILVFLAALLPAFMLAGCKSDNSSPSPAKAALTREVSNACAFPTQPAATPEQTAWEIFIAANCPSNSAKVVWENWVEQLQLYPASADSAKTFSPEERHIPRLHSSPLAQIHARQLHLKARTFAESLSSPCPPMQGPPSNVVKNATICEETRLNPEAQAFVVNGGYQIRSGQKEAAQKAVDIEFPTPAIEIKVDWIPSSDFSPQFSCDQPPAGIHVETIDGVCYAMAGMHISSKLLKNWLWATFEPQSMLTNPLRCVTFGPCNDAWGSDPATSTGGQGGFTRQTRQLEGLMKQANLSSEFMNYRLDGVQLDFTLPDGKTPTILGNSIIEGENVGLTRNQASCITCHSSSSIDKNGIDKGATLGTPVGAQYKIPSDWIARDFVWSMGIACPGGDGGIRPSESPCKASSTNDKHTGKASGSS